MHITLDDSGNPYASGEYRTISETFGYGYYEVSMMGTAGEGLMGGSFFVYTGIYGQPSHQEIDFEILGKDCSIQTNYYSSGQGGHEQIIHPAFDACNEFHRYGFRWAPDSLTFYIDGEEVRTVTSNIPGGQTRIMSNMWPGTTTVDAWLGHFTYQGPQQFQVDWIRYSTLEAAGE
jgi:beta-glucanase (GH16 family)